MSFTQVKESIEEAQLHCLRNSQCQYIITALDKGLVSLLLWGNWTHSFLRGETFTFNTSIVQAIMKAEFNVAWMVRNYQLVGRLLKKQNNQSRSILFHQSR